MKFKSGDICINPPGWRADCWLIESNDAGDPGSDYLGISLAKRALCTLREVGLVKIGEIAAGTTVAEIVALLLQPPPVPSETSPEYLSGSARAKDSLLICRLEEERYWDLLAKARPGDKLVISVGRRPEQVTFHNVLERGEKYVFLACDRKGKVFRYPLDCLVIP
jgi:hypothetical protein